MGTSIFVGLRSLDPLLQYGILAKGVGSGLLAKVGLEQLPAGLATNTGTIVDSLGLSPYRLILLAMSVGNAARQIYWLTALSNEEFTPQFAVMVSIYNSLWNSANDLLFTTAAFSASLSSGQAFPQWPLVVGVLSYVFGQGLETISELQRKKFKSDPKNKGKAYTGGLWKYARHINYTGYALWRAGYACAGGGFAWGAFALAWSLADFAGRSIPALDKYCSERVSIFGLCMF